MMSYSCKFNKSPSSADYVLIYFDPTGLLRITTYDLSIKERQYEKNLGIGSPLGGYSPLVKCHDLKSAFTGDLLEFSLKG